jgi:hypothetical protein
MFNKNENFLEGKKDKINFKIFIAFLTVNIHKWHINNNKLIILFSKNPDMFQWNY